MKFAHVKIAKQTGFSLIELMVTVAIIAILATLAFPSYQEFTARSNRSTSKIYISNISHALERYYTYNRAYTNSFATLRLSNSNDGYNYAITTTGVPPNAFTITSTPKFTNTDKLLLRQNQLGVQTHKTANAVLWLPGWP